METTPKSLAILIRRLLPAFSLVCAATFVGFTYSSASATPTADVTTGLVAYWNFDDANALGQSSTGGTPLIANNGAQYTANGKFGGGLLLNGNGQMLTSSTGTIDNLPIGNSSYTQSVWFKPAALGGTGFIGWGNYGGGNQTNALRMFGGGGGFRHYWWGNDLDSNVSLSTGTWYHVASTFDGTTRKLYLNGTLLVSDTPGGGHNATAEHFAIGRTCCSEYFDGVLDDIAIYNVALNANSIATLAATSPTTTTTTTTSTTTTTTTTTTTVAPALEIVVNAPVATSAPATTQPVGQSAIPTINSSSAPKATVVAPATLPAGPTTTEVPIKEAGTAKPSAPSIAVVAPGEAAVKVGDKSEPVVINRADNQLTVTAGALSATVGSLDGAGNVAALDAEGNVQLKEGDTVRIKLAGFKAGSTVEAWLFSTPQLMGKAKVGANGVVVGNFIVPKNVPKGSHRIAIVAQTVDGKPATLTLGVKVGTWKKEKSIAVWLIVLPIVLAIFGAMFLPAVIRRRRHEI